MSDSTASARRAALTAVAWSVASLVSLGSAAFAVLSSHLWFAVAFGLISAVTAFVGSARTEAVVRRRAAGPRRQWLVVLCWIGRLLIVPVGATVLVIRAAGGHEICSGGDDGRPGPSDNRQPTYYATYTSPQDRGQLRQGVLAAATRQQYEISAAAGGDFLDGSTARVALQTGEHAIRGACGNLSQTTTADSGQQLVTLRLVYPNSYWRTHHP